MRTSYQSSDICSVIVTYQTKINKFTDIVKRHQANFKQVIIVNNTPEIDFSQLQSKQVMLINNPRNIGLSAALNIGILEAKKQGADMVALFDQDTELPPHFTKDMLENINHYQGDKPVALYSPIFYNHVNNKIAKHINFKTFHLIRGVESVVGDYANPYFVITSGSIIPIEVLDDVGLMREDFFIDLVDTEWCLRARQRGYEIVTINKVMIDHFLGDYAMNIMGYKYPIHSPVRMYYYFRNAIFLYTMSAYDLKWSFSEALRDFLRFLFYMLFVRNRLTYFKYIIKGYYHGFIKKMGKLEE